MNRFARIGVTIGACVACFMGGRAVERDAKPPTAPDAAIACAYTMATVGATLPDATDVCRTVE